MPEDQDQTGTEEKQPVEATDTPQEGAQEDKGTDPKDGKNPEDDLPEWARERIQKANREAASYRTQLRETQDKLSKAKTPEEFEEITRESGQTIAKLELENLRLTVGVSAELPVWAIERLKGSTEEELKADAENLKKLLGPGQATRVPGDPSGGLDPSADDDSPADPKEILKQMKANRFF